MSDNIDARSAAMAAGWLFFFIILILIADRQVARFGRDFASVIVITVGLGQFIAGVGLYFGQLRSKSSLRGLILLVSIVVLMVSYFHGDGRRGIVVLTRWIVGS